MAKIIALSLFFYSSLAFSLDFDHSHKKWNIVLTNYRATSGFFYYSKFTENLKSKKETVFQEYITELLSVSFSEYEKWKKDEQKAFLINTYNALTIKLISENYPLESITDLGGVFWKLNKKPWSTEFFSLLSGKIKSLDPIEQVFLRSEKFADYRIHAALNCASISCPELRHEAFIAERLNEQLDEQMKIWILDKNRNLFRKKDGIKISKIFDWYEDDFKNWGGGVRAVLKRYSLKSTHSIIENKKNDIDYLDYDWNLNEEK